MREEGEVRVEGGLRGRGVVDRRADADGDRGDGDYVADADSEGHGACGWGVWGWWLWGMRGVFQCWLWS